MCVLRIIRIIFRISKTTTHTEQLRSIYLKQNHNIEGKQWFFFHIKTPFSNIKVSKQTEAWTPTTETNLQDVSLHEKQMDTLYYTQRRWHCAVWKQRTYLTHHSSFMSYEVHLCLFFGSSSPRASLINATDGNPKPSEFKHFKNVWIGCYSLYGF